MAVTALKVDINDSYNNLVYDCRVKILSSGNTWVSLPTGTTIQWVFSAINLGTYVESPTVYLTAVRQYPFELDNTSYITDLSAWPTYAGVLTGTVPGSHLLNDIPGQNRKIKIALSGAISAYFAPVLNTIQGDSVISGIVTDYSSNEYLISGSISESSNMWNISYGNVPVEYQSQYDNLTMVLTGSKVIATYQASYGIYPRNTTGYAVTNDRLLIYIPNLDTSYVISAIAVGEYSNGYGYLSPYELNLIEDEVYPNYVTLCALDYNQINYKKPIYSNYIRWVVSNPLTAINDNNEIIKIDNDYTGPISSDYRLKFYALSSNYYKYNIQATVPTNIINYYPTTASYDFYYDPIINDTLTITLLSSTDFSAWFKLSRLLVCDKNSYEGTYPINPLSSIKWDINPNNVTNTKMYSGLSGIDIEFPYNNITNLDMNDYAKTVLYNKSGKSGIIQSTPLTAVISWSPFLTAVTGYNNIVGLDLVQLDVSQNDIRIYNISGMYDDNSALTTYTFIPDVSTQSIFISALSYDLQPYVKELQLRLINNYNGYYTSVNSSDTVVWNATAPINNAVWATYSNGIPYTLGTETESSNVEIMNFYVSATKSSTFNLSSIAITVSATSTTSRKVTSDYHFNIYEFPPDNMWNIDYKINYENPRDVANNMWRLTGTHVLTATDLTNLSNPNNYQRIWNWGNSISTVTTSSTNHTFTTNALTGFTITLELSNVKNTSWPTYYAKEADDDMNIWYVERFLSGNFIIYPTIVFPTSSTDNTLILNTTIYTQTCGVCAYGEGHTEYFNISAHEPIINYFGSNPYTTTYKVRYNDKSVTGKNQISLISIPTNPGESFNQYGTAVALDVFNDIFPTTMVSAHTADNGNIDIYANFGVAPHTYAYTTSSSTNKFFQNIRTVPYETPFSNLDLENNLLIVQQNNTISVDAQILWPNPSPVTVYEGGSPYTNEYNWNISSQLWKTDETTADPNLDYLLSVGDGSVGTFRKGGNYTINIRLSGNVYGYIDYPPNDWQKSQRELTSSYLSLTAIVIPDNLIYPKKITALTGENVIIDPILADTLSDYVSVFLWDKGDGSAIVSTEKLNSLQTSYSLPGLYDLSVSAVMNNGYVDYKTHTDLINIISNYPSFDNSVVRVYGVTELKLPYTFDQIQIPQNEWIISENINNAFNKLLQNLDYLNHLTSMYKAPPTKYLGWLGSKYVDDTSDVNYGTNDFRWYTTVTDPTSTVNSTISAVSDNFSNVTDVAIKNNLLCVSNTTNFYLMSTDYSSTIISNRTYNTIGDNFVNIAAVDIDSQNRIYVLDNIRNKISVFVYDTSFIDTWKLLYSWGGLGGPVAKTKFYGPTDLYIDSQNNIWIVDSNNLVIKKYTSSGSWLQTINCSEFTNDNKPISLTIYQNIIYVLTKKTIVVLHLDGSYITSFIYVNPNKTTPKRIVGHYDGGFLYICLTDMVIKIMLNGKLAGYIADDIGGTHTYSGLYSDENRDLYVADTLAVLRYHDRHQIISVQDSKFNNFIWSNDAIYIDKNEYDQDWVYNKSFARLWSNHEILRRSITGKIIIDTTLDGKSIMSYRGFTPSEYQAIHTNTITKDTIYVGVNEFIAAPVINRCLKQFYDLQSQLLNLLK